MKNSAISEEHYNELVSRQVEQYKDTEVMHDLSAIYHYWSEKHTVWQAASVTGFNNTTVFYGEYFKKSLQESDSNFLISIGSGDCSIEIEIVKYLLSKGVTGFFFVCLELSPISVEKARKKIDAEQLGDIITVAQIDLNKWKPRYSFAGVMAHHSLHHILELENLFTLIRSNLAPNGRFVSCDIIGRNGHMRWPEALSIIRQIWNRLPNKYKYSNQLNKHVYYFENWDCSAEGFEGIRAQDILPLLIKNFSFEVFFSYGNLIDNFVDRNFGPNYDPRNPTDTAFIDYLQSLDDKLISEGILKPTTMIAVMCNEEKSPRINKNWSPSFALRDPALPPPSYDVSALLESMPLQAGPEDDPLLIRKAGKYVLNQKILFSGNEVSVKKAGAISGLPYLQYGWSHPEPDFIWSASEDAGLILPLENNFRTDAQLSMEFLIYRSPLYSHTAVEVFVNSVKVMAVSYPNNVDKGLITERVRLPLELIGNRDQLEISFLLPNRRQPQFETGQDMRAVGIALVSVNISKA